MFLLSGGCLQSIGHTFTHNRDRSLHRQQSHQRSQSFQPTLDTSSDELLGSDILGVIKIHFINVSLHKYCEEIHLLRNTELYQESMRSGWEQFSGGQEI